MCAQSLSLVPLFVVPWSIAPQAPLPIEFPRQQFLNGLPCPPLVIFLTQGSNPCLMSPALAGEFFTTSTTWEDPAPNTVLTNYKGLPNAIFAAHVVQNWVLGIFWP